MKETKEKKAKSTGTKAHKMKIVAINGSPRAKGNTFTLLNAMCKELKTAGFDTEILQIGKSLVRGCVACGTCAKKKNRRCALDGDMVNEHIETLAAADGIIVGSPVYYAGMAGTLKCYLDRSFYVCSANGGLLQHKVGAAIAVARRAGAVMTADAINKYFQIAGMTLPSGIYWNGAYGAMEGQCKEDAEGMQNALTVARNMAWILKLMEHGKDLPKPAQEPRAWTNFIR